jgi:serine/threonine protein kinase
VSDRTLALRTESVCDQFEAACRAGKRPDIESCLAGFTGPELAALVRELIALDVFWRRRAGERPEPREYRDRFPDHAALVDAAFASEPCEAETAPSGPATEAPAELSGYELLGEIGHGGMGVVYRARNKKQGSLVALKTVRFDDTAALDRLKQEFRKLVDVTHPNLVTLHELVCERGRWFFTMKLVDGVNFLSYVRAPVDRADAETTEDPEFHERSTVPGLEAAQPGAQCPPHPQPVVGAGDPRPGITLSPSQLLHLRQALRQLAEGLCALHDAGLLHRDVSPSNVLVTRAGHVVILDFGLAAEIDARGVHQSTEPHLLGKVVYMAPEQAAGLPVSSASDWYSVGVMLYEALTGRRPFEGRPLEVLADKQRFEPPPPRQLVADVPEDLDVLCADLLRRSPEARPVGRDVLRRLGGEPAGPEPITPTPLSPGYSTPWIGRETALEALTEALDDVRQGRTTAVYLTGASGLGKSALLRRFLKGLPSEGETLVLSGQCHPNEMVPYNAFDSLVDELARHLKRMPRAELEAVLPREIGALARVFRPLRAVEAVAPVPRRETSAVSPQDLRRRAFAGFRELLDRLGARSLLVLAIDDLQWGDRDSASLLNALLRPPDPPPLLFLGCYRSEDPDTSPFLQALDTPGRVLAVEPLTPVESKALALALLGDGPGAPEVAEAIAREARGSPLFLHLLAEHARTDGGALVAVPSKRPTLQEVLTLNVVGLPDDARVVLETFSLAVRPLPVAVALQVAGVGSSPGNFAVNLLKAGRFIRRRGRPDDDAYETSHNRIRCAVVARMEPEVRRDRNRRIGEVLEATQAGDADALAFYFKEGGERERAAHYYRLAAARADDTLAFHRAASSLLRALRLGSLCGEELRKVKKQLADSLDKAGKAARAARLYLEVAQSSDVAEAVALRQRAAMLLLLLGRIDEGLSVIADVLAAVGLRLPRGRRQAVASLLWQRVLARGSLRRFRTRNVTALDPGLTLRTDICWTLVAGLSTTDPVVAAVFQARALRFALRSGDPYRAARSLAVEATHVAATGGRSLRRAERLLEDADALARTVENPHALGIVVLARGMMAVLRGSWRDGSDLCRRAEMIFREKCLDARWVAVESIWAEIDYAHVFLCAALCHAGQLDELARVCGEWAAEACERGNLSNQVNMVNPSMTLLKLAADDPAGALWVSQQVIRGWSARGFHVQHHNALRSAVLVDLYRGDGAAGWERLTQSWPQYGESGLDRIQFTRVEWLELRARCALSAAATVRDPRRFLRAAESDARRLAREGLPWPCALADQVFAGVAACRRDRDLAADRLALAVDRFSALGMGLHADAARLRLAGMTANSEEATATAEATQRMAAQGVRAVDRFTDLYAPGFPNAP